ncbi:flagellar biosynthesis anti-sigma factor FlgM [Bacillus sp. FJAT-49736]|uniref:flagellar biosynthesis anti-sigma factor FlgM n=1 Tax=Bacillus sp. FJAT-49736 TaxID=2833582 RepID=UPI001BC9AAD4|nr:flagellar biosynthesis anti-sigma factor FlgM [Bacillus sp. FJAT-49736]MBS4174166.1 flagellar biosynthesis anti-sigma factor FlgM [Bacillus sp. FJAT-49736]
MKINNYGTSGINPYKQQMNKINQMKNINKPNDKVEISTTAKEMQQVSSIEKERQAKVEQLKIQVENGQYKVDSKAIANGIAKFYLGK